MDEFLKIKIREINSVGLLIFVLILLIGLIVLTFWIYGFVIRWILNLIGFDVPEWGFWKTVLVGFLWSFLQNGFRIFGIRKRENN